jgi:hypothetical protein
MTGLSFAYALRVDPVTTPFERGLHLLLFISAAAALGVTAVALLERLSDDAHRTIRIVHVVLSGLVFAAFFVAERVYHSVH